MREARLRLVQLLSPALPVGAFSYSEGVEVLVQQGRMDDAAAVDRWLRSELARGVLAADAAALRPLGDHLASWRDGGSRDPVAELDGWLLAQREAPELRAQQRQMGGSLVELLGSLGWPLPAPLVLCWPAAFAWAGLCLEIPLLDLVEGYLYGWVANQLSAAVRLVPLGSTEAQRLQLDLAPLLTARAAVLSCQDPRLLWNSGVGAGIAQLGHDELYSRLFRS